MEKLTAILQATLAALFWIIILLMPVQSARAQNPSNANPERLALTNVTVIDGTGAVPLSNMTVVIKDGKIEEIFSTATKSLPTGTIEMDLSGKYLIPGLINSHVHFDRIGLGRDPERIKKELRRMLYGGVTTAFSAAGDSRLLGSLQRSLALKELDGPDIYYTALMAAPDFMNNDPRVANSSQGLPRGEAAWSQTVTRETDDVVAVARALGTHASALKFYIGVDADVIRAMTEEAHRHGMKVWAHSTVFPDRPIDVVRAGVDVITHVAWIVWQDADLDPSINVPFTHTDPQNPRPTFDISKVEPDSPEMLKLFQEMVKHGTLFDVTASIFAYRPGAAKIDKMRDFVVKILHEAHNIGVQFTTGTDYFVPEEIAFPSVFREIEFLVSEGILSPIQAITAATNNGARAIGMEEKIGTIAPGKMANLVVLREDPTQDIRAIRSIELVFKDGRSYERRHYEAERQQSASSELAGVERAVRVRLAAEQRAFADGDCDAVVQFYAEAEPLLVTGGKIIPTRRALLLACGSMVSNRSGMREIDQEDVIVLNPSTVYSVTRYIHTVPGSKGTITKVITKLWSKQGDVWRIVHFHESSEPKAID